MNIAVLGTGGVGRTLAMGLTELGHSVIIGTTDPQRTMARTEGDNMGNPPFAQWARQNPGIRLGTYAEAAAHGDIVINATNGSGSLAALSMAGEANLRGKVLVDVSNPLDFSQGMPPSLFVSNTDSLAEQIQRAFPLAKVVKTLNTVTAALMINPAAVAGADHTIFVSGNDASAKAVVTELLRGFGWQDVLDLGDISTARGAEMYLPLWLLLWAATGTGMFNVKVMQ